ncbi:MAG: TIGR02391 family protein [Clostridia bacterium]|nr:TIGR02391 family protein [Clostridia bacterium]
MRKIFTESDLRNISGVIADTNNGLTKSELERHLVENRIEVLSDGSYSNQFGYRIGLNKRDWLYNCLANEMNKSLSDEKVVKFIESSMSPVNYTKISQREKYNYILEELNKVLLLIGCEINLSGKLVDTSKAETLNEVDRRVNSLREKLYTRNIHEEVMRYCKSDYLRKDYYDTVFEATKGLAERVREITGLTEDGTSLFDKAFSTKSPYIVFNALNTESERNEYIGLKELLNSLFHLIRNRAAHTPKINWKQNESEVLDVLTMISFVHKYLDKCCKYPGKI